MPVVIDPMENEVLRKWYFEALEKGAQQGQLTALSEVLRGLLAQKYGSVPGWANDRIAAAGVADLARWTQRVIGAASLDDVFAV